MELHPQLLQDCHVLGRYPRTHVLLQRNGIVPWLILVPETAERDLLDLPSEQCHEVMTQASCAAAVIKQLYAVPKINFAAIGNVVPQLHLHVVGRSPNDHCWPKPVWGNLTATREYPAEEIDRVTAALGVASSAASLEFQRA